MNRPSPARTRPPAVRYGTVRLLLLLGCVAGGPPPNAEEVRDEMADHWDTAQSARDAVIAGNLDAARRLASGWGERPIGRSDTVADARKELDAPFAKLALASTLGEAGESLGDIADACGSCHVRASATRSFEPPAPPQTASAMSHHRAAADGMWAGLVAPSESLFATGAATLGSANFAPSGLPTGGPVERQALELEVAVQDLAARAARSRRPKQRARLYGQMLGNCAACHTVTGGGPEATSGPAAPIDAPLTAEMHARFAVLTQARNAVQGGDLEAARQHGENLLSFPAPTGFPTNPWRPYLVEVRTRAEALAQAPTLDDAGLAVARVAVSCGGCHASVGGGPAVPREDEVDVVASSGMDLLWLGLLTSSDETWLMGAGVVGDPDLLHKPPGEARAAAFAERLR